MLHAKHSAILIRGGKATPMRIGELARRAGTTTRTLRYYETRGLLSARRGENGYRSYDEDDVRLLRQIRLLQDFGFELEETRPFVDCLRAGHPHGDSCPASLDVYRRKLAELDACIDRLREVRDQVGAQLTRAELAREELRGEARTARAPRCELTGPMEGTAPMAESEPTNGVVR